MEYQIQSGNVIHALRSDYAWGVREFSPGAYLNVKIIQSLFEAGDVAEYDMGPGNNDYKLRWASGTRDSIRIEIYRDSLYGRLLNTIETKMVPLAQTWRDRARPAGRRTEAIA
jgi:CelD/BcsL family acetyltransferase involved in cellulose biosynthesis